MVIKEFYEIFLTENILFDHDKIYGHLEGVLEEKASFYDFGYNVFFNI